MAPHSSILAWKIPWMEEPGRLQSMGSLRVQHDWVTSLSLSCIGEGNGNPLQCSCLENLRDGEPGGLLSMGSHRVRHNWSDLAAAAAGYYFREGNGTPLQYSCLENPMDGGVWWAAIYGVTQSRTQLKWLSSSSRSRLLFGASLVAQPIKNLPAVQETPVWFLGQEDPLEKG